MYGRQEGRLGDCCNDEGESWGQSQLVKKRGLLHEFGKMASDLLTHPVETKGEGRAQSPFLE